MRRRERKLYEEKVSRRKIQEMYSAVGFLLLGQMLPPPARCGKIQEMYSAFTRRNSKHSREMDHGCTCMRNYENGYPKKNYENGVKRTYDL